MHVTRCVLHLFVRGFLRVVFQRFVRATRQQGVSAVVMATHPTQMQRRVPLNILDVGVATEFQQQRNAFEISGHRCHVQRWWCKGGCNCLGKVDALSMVGADVK